MFVFSGKLEIVAIFFADRCLHRHYDMLDPNVCQKSKECGSRPYRSGFDSSLTIDNVDFDFDIGGTVIAVTPNETAVAYQMHGWNHGINKFR